MITKKRNRSNRDELEKLKGQFLLNESVDRIKNYILLGYYDREKIIGRNEACKWAWEKFDYFCSMHQRKVESLRDEWTRLQVEIWMRKEIGNRPLSKPENLIDHSTQRNDTKSPSYQNAKWKKLSRVEKNRIYNKYQKRYEELRYSADTKIESDYGMDKQVLFEIRKEITKNEMYVIPIRSLKEAFSRRFDRRPMKRRRPSDETNT